MAVAGRWAVSYTHLDVYKRQDTFAYILPTQITAAVIAHGTDTFSSTDYARAGWVSVCIAIAYGLLVMAPWYALWGMPVWDASAPWPF